MSAEPRHYEAADITTPNVAAQRVEQAQIISRTFPVDERCPVRIQDDAVVVELEHDWIRRFHGGCVCVSVRVLPEVG